MRSAPAPFNWAHERFCVVVRGQINVPRARVLAFIVGEMEFGERRLGDTARLIALDMHLLAQRFGTRELAFVRDTFDRLRLEEEAECEAALDFVRTVVSRVGPLR